MRPFSLVFGRGVYRHWYSLWWWLLSFGNVIRRRHSKKSLRVIKSRSFSSPLRTFSRSHLQYSRIPVLNQPIIHDYSSWLQSGALFLLSFWWSAASMTITFSPSLCLRHPTGTSMVLVTSTVLSCPCILQAFQIMHQSAWFDFFTSLESPPIVRRSELTVTDILRTYSYEYGTNATSRDRGKLL